MKKILKHKQSLNMLVSLMMISASNAWAHDYEVTITNITQNQVFTPILGFIHSPDISPFTLGQPAFAEVATIAESGNTGPALEALATLPSLASGGKDSAGVLAPGKSVTLEFDEAEGMTRLSLLAMLIPTNDAFFGLNSVELPVNIADSSTHRSVAYDAGTELNDELCANIPGPPSVCSGEGESTSDGEGFVHIHPGIHGIGDLAADRYDWRNPVAQVTIIRVLDENE